MNKIAERKIYEYICTNKQESGEFILSNRERLQLRTKIYNANEFNEMLADLTPRQIIEKINLSRYASGRKYFIKDLNDKIVTISAQEAYNIIQSQAQELAGPIIELCKDKEILALAPSNLIEAIKWAEQIQMEVERQKELFKQKKVMVKLPEIREGEYDDYAELR